MFEEFNTFFENGIRSLSVKPDEYYLSDKENLSDPAETAVRKFENHPSAPAVNQNISVNHDFYFCNTDVSDILDETTALKIKRMVSLVIS